MHIRRRQGWRRSLRHPSGQLSRGGSISRGHLSLAVLGLLLLPYLACFSPGAPDMEGGLSTPGGTGRLAAPAAGADASAPARTGGGGETGGERPEGPHISEFMASNGDFLADEDLDHPDWIEIYNPGGTTVDLEGWHLTDDPYGLDLWTFPSVDLGPGDRLVVFASGKDRRVPGEQLHADFELSAEGEYLALVEPGASSPVQEFAPAYPPQKRNASYGYQGDGGPVYLYPATPGGANDASGSYGRMSRDVRFSRPGGTFVETMVLKLSGPDPAHIRYTVNGSMPRETSLVYTGPITLTATTWVRAQSFEPDLLPGPVHSEVYFALDARLQDMDSSIPLVILDTFSFDLTFIEDDWEEEELWGGTPSEMDMDNFTMANRGGDARQEGEGSAGAGEADGTRSVGGDAGTRSGGTGGGAEPMTLRREDAYPHEDHREWYEIEPLWHPLVFRTVLGAFMDVDETGRASITGEPDYVSNAGMHLRGASSLDYKKKQFAFECRNEWGVDEDVELLGLPPESDWVIHGPYSDKTFMRNYQIYDWSNDIGHYGARGRFIEVFLDVDGGQVTPDAYQGVYVLLEKIKQGPYRVDIEELLPSQNTGPELTGGYLLKKDWFDSDYEDEYFRTATYEDPLLYIDPVNDEITQEQKDYIAGYFAEFESVLSSDDFTDPVDGYVNYIDPATFVDHHILVEMARNADGYVVSTFVWKDREGRIEMGSIWDYNGALGNADYFHAGETEGWHYLNPEFPADNPFAYEWYMRLFDDPEFLLLYADRWFEYRRGPFATEKLHADIDENAALLEEPAERNFDKWPILGEYIWPNAWGWEYRASYADEVQYLKDWLEDRTAWMDREIAETYAAYPPDMVIDGEVVMDGRAEPGDELTITTSRRDGVIYYTLDGTDPHLPGVAEVTTIIPHWSRWLFLDNGSTPPDDWRTAELDWPDGKAQLGYGDGDEFTVIEDARDQPGDPGAISYYFQQRFLVEDPSDFPELTIRLIRDDGAVVYINGVEVIRSNIDPDATITPETVAYEATDTEARWHEYTFPNNGLLEAGENVIAVEVHQSNEYSTDLSFDLEMLYTHNEPPPASPSAIEYTGPITLDASSEVRSRILAEGNWSAVNTMSMRQEFPRGIVINEIMARNGGIAGESDGLGEYPDWIELYNAGEERVDLGGMYLTDLLYDPTRWALPTGTALEPGGYLVVWADGTPGRGGLHADLRLDAGGETVCLFAPDGETLLDSAIYFTQTDNESYGRYPDGGQEWQRMWETPTPGSANLDHRGAQTPGGLRINELMADNEGVHLGSDPADPFPDWIELYNGGDEAVDLGGFYLTDDLTAPMKWEFPRGTTIGAGAYLVVLAGSGGGGNGPAAGFGLGRAGESVGLFFKDGRRLLDSLTFGEQFGDISYGRASWDPAYWEYMLVPSPGAVNVENPEDELGPVAFAAGDAYAEAGTPVDLDGSASRDNMGIVGYVWEFQDNGQHMVLTGRRQSYTFNEPGTYTVNLTVVDTGGNTGMDSIRVQVYPGGGTGPPEPTGGWYDSMLIPMLAFMGAVILAMWAWDRRRERKAVGGDMAGAGAGAARANSGGGRKEAAHGGGMKAVDGGGMKIGKEGGEP